MTDKRLTAKQEENMRMILKERCNYDSVKEAVKPYEEIGMCYDKDGVSCIKWDDEQYLYITMTQGIKNGIINAGVKIDINNEVKKCTVRKFKFIPDFGDRKYTINRFDSLTESITYIKNIVESKEEEEVDKKEVESED